MEPLTPDCPACGSDNTESAESVWESGAPEHAASVQPPVPRAATTNLGRFYAIGCLWLLITVLVTLFLRNHAAHRPESVAMVTVLAVILGILQIARLMTGRPKPTDDQMDALAEWHVAHAKWQRTRLCLRCGTTFLQPYDP